jgi:hypothetical protein
VWLLLQLDAHWEINGSFRRRAVAFLAVLGIVGTSTCMQPDKGNRAGLPGGEAEQCGFVIWRNVFMFSCLSRPLMGILLLRPCLGLPLTVLQLSNTHEPVLSSSGAVALAQFCVQAMSINPHQLLLLLLLLLCCCSCVRPWNQRSASRVQLSPPRRASSVVRCPPSSAGP